MLSATVGAGAEAGRLPGSQIAATTAPSTAKTAEPIDATCIAVMKASLACWINAGPAGPTCSATPYAPEIDSSATLFAAAGRPSVEDEMPSRQEEGMTAPRAATPRA